eukprot:CAMPEP_0168594498 /NCGR_PEP_ID=MMETSP0420-20121227/8932_1 /TAXON_ID=498008 /ORGANISM="Pessonella sp." /LENGTH=171 /DNA_ID=CAMNT_0008630825 /DNA_START=604 /DNA_END=1115 /DNA_ORIENTATION=+
MTGIKKNVISVEENWRTEFAPIHQIIGYIRSGVVPQTFLFRQLFQNPRVTNFATALRSLASTAVAVPMYVTAAGPSRNQAAVLTYGAMMRKVLKLERFDRSWSLVQTNYDRWQPDPLDDPRRTAAELLIERMGQSLIASSSGVLLPLTITPVSNEDTVYTTLANVSNGTLT